MKGRGKSKPKKKAVTTKKSHDHSLGSSLEMVNTQTHVDELSVATVNLSATLDAGHAVSEVSLNRRQYRPVGPERSLSSPCSKALVPRGKGGLNRDTAGDVVVTWASGSHPVNGQNNVPTRLTGGPLGTSVAPVELPARQEQAGIADDKITVVMQSGESLNGDENTVSEFDREVDDGEVDITFCSQHLQRSIADEVQNKTSDRSCELDSSQHRSVVKNRVCDSSCEHDSSQHRSVHAVAENKTSDSSCERDSRQQSSIPAVVKNSMSDRSCESDSRQQRSLSAVAENSMFDRSCERSSSQQHSVFAAVENSASGSVCKLDSRYCLRPQPSVVMSEVSDRRSSQEVLLSAEQKRKRDDSCHVQHLQRDVQNGIYDGFCSMKSLQQNSENLARDVTCHTQSLQTSVTDTEPRCSRHGLNSRTDDVTSHRSRRQSRVMNAGHSTRRYMKYSDVESDVHSDSCDDEVEIVNSSTNALGGKQTPVSYSATETERPNNPQLYITKHKTDRDSQRQTINVQHFNEIKYSLLIM